MLVMAVCMERGQFDAYDFRGRFDYAVVGLKGAINGTTGE